MKETEDIRMTLSVSDTKYTAGADGTDCDKTTRDIEIRTYSYENGKGQEKVYQAKDCVELSLESYTIPIGCELQTEIPVREGKTDTN